MNGVAGAGGLIRLILRRDRWLLPIWVVLLAVLPATYASATEGLYPTAEGRQEYYASIVANPSLLSTIGPVFGDSLGALTAWRSGILLLFIGLVSLLTVIRHTRTEEDAGRRELLGATVVGRHAPLAAALAVTGAANLTLGLIMALALAGYGLPMAGSLAFGLSFAAAGLVFAAVGAVAAQLTQGAGAARGIAIAVLGAAYLLRAAGDAAGEAGGLSALSWLSPIGWVQRVRPYADEQWWLFVPVLGLAAALTALAAGLLARRDAGAGVLPARLGRPGAGPWLGSPLGLAWRLHRGLLLGWTAGFAVIGAVIGGAAESIDTMVEGSPQLGEMLARLGGATSLKDAYIAAGTGMLALAVSAYAIQATLRLRTEEVGLRAEPVLATSVGRLRWAASHLAFAAAGPAVVLTVFGVAVGLVSGPTAQLFRPVGGALAYLPAVWLLAAMAVALFGLLPRLAAAVAWAVLAGCVLLAFVGPLLQLDQWVLDASPFNHIPKLPGEAFTATPGLWLLAVTVVLAATGLAAFRRRDIVSSA
ncbi:MAG TPA: ABC transporter permease [Pilimelia sp.]|nr:ABC transporter permease [Pilimelia sp.]